MLAARHKVQVHRCGEWRADADALDGIGQCGACAQAVRFLVDGDVDAVGLLTIGVWRDFGRPLGVG
jgi:hypothetical protein